MNLISSKKCKNINIPENTIPKFETNREQRIIERTGFLKENLNEMQSAMDSQLNINYNLTDANAIMNDILIKYETIDIY